VIQTDISSIFFASYSVTSFLSIVLILKRAAKKNTSQSVRALAEGQKEIYSDWKAAAAQLSRELQDLIG
jgi:hypothetical protein